MLDTKYLKPIPKYILRAIYKKDKLFFPTPTGMNRFYAYLAVWEKELVKITVAVKHFKKQWYCKQVAVHGLHSEHCLVRDLEYCYLTGMGFRVGWYSEGIQTTQKCFEDGRWYLALDGAYDPYATIINPAMIYKFPEYKYCAYDLYNGVDVLQYLRLYEQYPQVEYLVKLGFKDYCHSKQILEKVKTDKVFCRWLLQNKSEIAAQKYYVSTILKAYKKHLPCDEIQRHETLKKELTANQSFKQIRATFKGSIDTFVSYLLSRNVDLYNYKDYFDACTYLALDMSLERNRCPHDFKRWHDIRIDECHTAKALKDAEERKELYAQFATVSTKYSSLQFNGINGFACIIARSPAELIREGKILNHCVGRMNYDQKFIREETLIFFIRLQDNPSVPFVTVEYSPHKKSVLQCYAANNQRPTDEAWEFVHKQWLPYANKQLKQIAA